MGSRLKGWSRLDWPQRMHYVGLATLLVPVHVSLLLFGYARTKYWLDCSGGSKARREATPREFEGARNLVKLASIAGRHGLVNATCLRQSLLVYFLLRCKGLAPEIKLGVRRQAGTFDAHAWVELDDIVLGQENLAHVPLHVPPAARGAP